MLQKSGRRDIEVEVVFPVASKAIATREQKTSTSPIDLPGDLRILPGSAVGEGCSLDGGCAACPFMRMNTLSSLQSIANRVQTPGEILLEKHKPRPYSDLINGKTVAKAGCVPILHMRHFQMQKRLSDALVDDIKSRADTRKS